MSKKVAIIGAGLAGLSAGIYLQKSGLDTEIFELAPWAGGVCTAWVRQGYRFDGCIHWMVGTQQDTDFYRLYREVGALAEDTKIYNSGSILSEINGQQYEIPLQMPQFREFLHSLSSEDSAKIDSICNDIDKLVKTKMPGGAPTSLAGVIKMMKESRGFIQVMPKYLKLKVSDYVEGFHNPTLKAVFYHLMPGDFSMSALMMMLGTRMSGNGGYPMGGALEVIERMQSNYNALGGKIHFQSKVDQIVVENGRVKGIQVKGEFFSADSVVVASDAHDALFTLLGGKYVHPQLNDMLEHAPLFQPLALVSFGLDKQFGIPYAVGYEVPAGIEVAPGNLTHGLGLRSFEFDPSSAPAGCSSVMISLSAPLEYWQDLRNRDLAEYKKQKQLLADQVAEVIEAHYPGFKKAIQVTDVATPATYVHLVNLYQGSFEGFTPTPKALSTNLRKTLPGIQNLVLCGQWTTPGGGICTAISSGKEAAQLSLRMLK
jgi:Phytoene dehydrogenase and related proteins